jgi:hypothetical protein
MSYSLYNSSRLQTHHLSLYFSSMPNQFATVHRLLSATFTRLAAGLVGDAVWSMSKETRVPVCGNEARPGMSLRLHPIIRDSLPRVYEIQHMVGSTPSAH